MSDCIFCKIISGEIPSAKVYDQGGVYAFLDIAPVNKGHALVVPKKHYATLFDLPPDLGRELLTALKTVGQAVMTATGAAGLNVETQLEARKLGKQLQYADKAGIRFVAIRGEDEAARGVVAVKDLQRGDQFEVADGDLPEALARARTFREGTLA